MSRSSCIDQKTESDSIRSLKLKVRLVKLYKFILFNLKLYSEINNKTTDWNLLGNFVQDHLTLTSKREMNLMVSTLDGKVVLTTTATVGTNNISVSNLISGMYLIIDLNTGTSKQFVKQ